MAPFYAGQFDVDALLRWERHRIACCSHADARQWIAGRDKWERLTSTGGENCGQQGIRDFKDLVPPVAPAGTPGVNCLSGGRLWLSVQGLEGGLRVFLPAQNVAAEALERPPSKEVLGSRGSNGVQGGR